VQLNEANASDYDLAGALELQGVPKPIEFLVFMCHINVLLRIMQWRENIFLKLKSQPKVNEVGFNF